MQYRIFLLPILLLVSLNAFAQGCSDAGFCTLGRLGPGFGSLYQKPTKHKITALTAVGAGDEHVVIVAPAVQYDYTHSDQWAFQGKVTANYAKGNLGTASGLGDLAFTAIRSLRSGKVWQSQATFGVKIPLANGSQTANGFALPMQYQSSLGTGDLIAGITVSDPHWSFSAAYQQPIFNYNKNQFLPTIGTDRASVEYLPGRDFKRKGDVLLKGIYNLTSIKKFRGSGGLLGIYHLGQDSYVNNDNTRVNLTGSEGLTLNGIVEGWYTLSPKIALGLVGGAPFVVRKIRPDGLTRSYVIAPEISISF